MMALIYTNDKSHLKETIQIKTKDSRGKKKQEGQMRSRLSLFH